LAASTGYGQVARRWDFNRSGDQEEWTIPKEKRGVVIGGSVWLTLEPKETDPSKMATAAYQVSGDLQEGDNAHASSVDNLAISPVGLHIPATEVTQIRLRVLNLSSLLIIRTSVALSCAGMHFWKRDPGARAR